ncbi:MAG: alpha/beta hydrolase [Actinomycetota bacterium]|nr:alpha/beta hydrolase [Actinomycetota bacterium]
MPTTESNGTAISYNDSGGDGTPVLLVHAFPLNGAMWESQVQTCGDRYRLLVPDLKGFGGSDAPDDPSAYTMDGFADDLKAVMDACGLDRIVLAGLSIGGYIAFAFWRKYSSSVAGLVLADTRAEPDPPEGVEKRTNQQNLVRSEGTEGLIEALTQALLSEKTRSNKPDVVDRAKQLMDNPAAGFVGALEAMKNRPDSTGDLAAIDVPVLVIVGEEDAITPPTAAQAMDEKLPNSKLIAIPEAGHLSSLEGPEAFNGALAEFLATF